MRRAVVLTALSAIILGLAAGTPFDFAAGPSAHRVARAGASHPVTRTVSGTAVHYFTTAMIHSKEPTETGFIQRSTDIVELSGDLRGRILYHPTSVFDLAKGTLVNTGHQVFSGTVLGSAPVMIHDDAFQFRVDLNTGQESGEVHLSDVLAGPRISCALLVVGTGVNTVEGDALVDYEGTCTFKR